MKTNPLTIVHANYKDLYRFVFRMAGNHEIAEDIVQEAFLRFARKCAHRLDGIEARKWLFVVCRNQCMTWLRRQALITECPVEWVDESLLSDKGPLDEALDQERAVLVRHAIYKLPSKLREVILLREFESMSYEEIASTVECPVGTVRSRLSQAREHLRQALHPLMENQS